MTPLDGYDVGMLQERVSRRGPTSFLGHDVICSRGWYALQKSLGLSPREFEILQRIFDDLNEQKIAAELGISQHTVHTHLERLYRKVHVSSRIQLVVHVMAQHIALSSTPLVDN